MGDFTIHGSEHMWTTTDAPIVLLSAGVGMTPMLSMLHSLEDHKLSHKPGHKMLWLHGARNGREHAFRDYLVSMSQEHPGEVTRRVWYSDASKDDIRGESNHAKYHFDGTMDLEAVRAHLPLDDERAQYYYCGPLPFMQSIQSQLTALGVPRASQHYEAFGPAEEALSG